jgi:2-aminobenzoate-CoA ligase
MAASGYIDPFVANNLPAEEDWPQFIYRIPELAALLEVPYINCADVLFSRTKSNDWHNRPCIWLTPHQAWSYAQLEQQAHQIAAVLTLDMGLQTGQRVLLRGRNSAILAAGWLGVLLAGGVVVTTHPQWRQEELAKVIHKTCINHALCEDDLRDDWERAAQASGLPIQTRYWGYSRDDALESAMRVYPAYRPPAVTAWHDVAILAPTSGSTGEPKITAHTHRDVWAACLCWPQAHLQTQIQDVFVGNASLAFTFGLGGLLLFPMYAGASIVLNHFHDMSALLQGVMDYQATILMATPTAYRMMMRQAAPLRSSALRICVSAGELLPVSTHQNWHNITGLDLLNGMGSTEMLHIFISGTAQHQNDESIGTVVTGYEACVIDERGNTVTPGTQGYLAVRGPTGCRYLSDERQKKYVQNGWNITGDWVVQDEKGQFYFVGRCDDVIISGGNNISPSEVESALLQHTAVAECAVAGMDDDERGQIVAAYVVLQPSVIPSAVLTAELQSFVKQQLAPYKYPRRIFWVAALPRTASGKLQRHHLPTLLASTQSKSWS